MSETKFKKGDTVYWIEDDEETPYGGHDDPAPWIVKGKVVSIHPVVCISDTRVELPPVYVVEEDAESEFTCLEENKLFTDVPSIYDPVIKNLSEHIAILRKKLEYIKERKKHSSELQ